MTATATEAPPSREEQRLRRVIEFERTSASKSIEHARAEVRSSRNLAKGLGYAGGRVSRERLDAYQREFTAALERIDAVLAKAEEGTNACLLTDALTAPAELEDSEQIIVRGVEAAWQATWPTESPAPTEAENPLLWAQVRAIVAAVQP